MKKTLTAAALSSVMVLGLATSALAIHETATAEQAVVAAGTTKVTLDGNVRVRGYYDRDNWNNDDSDNSGIGDPGRSGYDTRVQMGLKAQVSPEATGYIKLESGANNSDVYAWGSGMVANDGLFNGGQKMGSLNILEAWVNYQPGMWGLKAGHMPLALGNKIFFDHTGSGDDALVFYANLNEATHVAALTIKFDEQNNRPFTTTATTSGDPDSSDDLDGYVALITHKLSDTVNLGANWTYLQGGSDSAKDLFSEPFNGLSMSNIGLTADGKVGAISYLADLEIQLGDVADVDNVINVDAGGWAAKLGGNYDLGGGKIGLLFGYGSGDDAVEAGKDLAKSPVLGGTDTNVDHEGYINFLTDTTYDTIIAGYRSPIPGAASWTRDIAGLGGGAQASSLSGRNTGLSNLTLFQLNGSSKVVCPLTGKDLSLFASASYMQLSEDTVNGTESDGSLNEVDNVGTELDLIATWALTAGLNYKVEAAYMWTGDVYETMVAGDSDDPENLAFIRHSLDLKF